MGRILFFALLLALGWYALSQNGMVQIRGSGGSSALGGITAAPGQIVEGATGG